MSRIAFCMAGELLSVNKFLVFSLPSRVLFALSSICFFNFFVSLSNGLSVNLSLNTEKSSLLVLEDGLNDFRCSLIDWVTFLVCSPIAPLLSLKFIIISSIAFIAIDKTNICVARVAIL